MKDSIIITKSFDFALRIIKISNFLVEYKKQYAIADQLIRSGTSIGANIREANSGFSKADFRYKMSIALKEANETEYWLQLILHSEMVEEKNIKDLIGECNEICKILACIVKNSK